MTKIVMNMLGLIAMESGIHHGPQEDHKLANVAQKASIPTFTMFVSNIPLNVNKLI